MPSASPREDAILARLVRAAADLPEVEQSLWYGTPALKVRGKGFCRIKDAGTVVVMVDPDEKEMLLEAAPGFYFETDHYRGWPAMLVRMTAIPDDALKQRLRAAWLRTAPKSLAKRFAAG